MEEKTRVGMTDARVGTKAGNKKKRNIDNDVRAPIEKKHWLVH